MPERMAEFIPVRNTIERHVALPSDVDLMPIFARAPPDSALFQADHHLSAGRKARRALVDEMRRRFPIVGP